MATIDEKLEALKAEYAEKAKKLKALKQQQEARARAAEAGKRRKQETREKVLLGAFLRDVMQQNGISAATLTYEGKRFADWLVKQHDRDVFGLPQQQQLAQQPAVKVPPYSPSLPASQSGSAAQ